jgi:hypothetical protein
MTSARSDYRCSNEGKAGDGYRGQRRSMTKHARRHAYGGDAADYQSTSASISPGRIAEFAGPIASDRIRELRENRGRPLIDQGSTNELSASRAGMV